MTQLKTTHQEVYVVGLSSYGGCWLPSGRYYHDYQLARRVVEERRTKGEKCQLFTLFGYEEVKDAENQNKSGEM